MNTNTITPERIAELKECLDYIRDNPTRRFPMDWIDGVKEEAREAGLIPKLAPRLGCNCPKNPYPAVYGGDMEDIF